MGDNYGTSDGKLVDLGDVLQKIYNSMNPLGGMDVYVQDQYTDIVDYYLCRYIGDLTLAQDATMDEYTIQVSDGTGVANGTYVCIQESNRAFQARVLSGGGTNTLTLDTPLDYAFTTSAVIQNRTPDLNVDGSTATVAATLGPIPGSTWDITRIILSMTHSGAADDGKFGDLTALTKGIVLRKSDGVHHTIFNAKTNGDIRERMYDVEYSDRAPGGEYGTSGRRSFGGQDKNGVVIRLNGDLSETIDILIQDDLSGLSTFKIVAQGHVVE